MRLAIVIMGFLALNAFAGMYPNVYSETDAIEFVHIASLSYCPIAEIQDFNCGVSCQFLAGYEVFFVTEVPVSYNESFSFNMLYNPTT